MLKFGRLKLAVVMSGVNATNYIFIFEKTITSSLTFVKARFADISFADVEYRDVIRYISFGRTLPGDRSCAFFGTKAY